MKDFKPSKQYIALLSIKAIIRDWQDMSLSDYNALTEIDRILITLRKEDKNV